MSEMALPQILPLENKHDGLDALGKTRKRWLDGFFVSVIIGAAFGITGLIISGLETVGLFQASASLDQVAVGLITVAFPLLVLAAHCLDKAADTKRAIKRISYKEKNK